MNTFPLLIFVLFFLLFFLFANEFLKYLNGTSAHVPHYTAVYLFNLIPVMLGVSCGEK